MNYIYDIYKDKNGFIKQDGCYYLKCESCKLNTECNPVDTEIELDTKYLYYKTADQKNCPFRNYNITLFKRNSRWVADGIRSDYKKWTSEIPVFISAPTGKGKNHFIENKLLRYVEELNIPNPNKSVLLLSNRIALRLQIKKRIENKFPFVKIKSYQELLDYIDSPYFTLNYLYVIIDECHFFTSDSIFNPDTDTILNSIVEMFINSIRVYMTATPFDCLEFICEKEDIVTYRQIRELEDEQEKEKQLIELIDSIDDEDSLFRKDDFDDPRFVELTGDNQFRLENIEDFNRDCEDKRRVLLNKTMYYYHFDRDYSFLDIKYFTNYDELYPRIAESGEKWLIFIDSESECKKVKEKLIHPESGYHFKEDDIFVMSAEIKRNAEYKNDDENKKISESYQYIIDNEKFKQKILITTSVLDNGINLKDSELSNIVISDMNKAKCLQMLGRIRVKNGEMITLYLKRFDSEFIVNRIKDLDEIKYIYYDYDMGNRRHKLFSESSAYKQMDFYNKYYNGKVDDWENAKHLFGRSREFPAHVTPNKIARSLIQMMTEKYESILSEMQESDNNHSFLSGQKYLEYQLGWFNQIYETENDLTYMKMTGFSDYLESLLDREINNEKNKFAIEFQEKFCDVYGHRTKAKGFSSDENTTETIRDGYGKNKINDVLKVLYEKGQINISMEIYTDKVSGSWKFRKISDESE